MPKFKVIMRVSGCAHLPPRLLPHLKFEDPNASDVFEIEMLSEYAEGQPGDLVIIGTCTAPDLDSATNYISARAQVVINGISAATSTAFQYPRLDCAYSVSFDEAERPAKIHFPFAGGLVHPVTYRSIDHEAVIGVVGQLLVHPDAEVLRQAARNLANAIRLKTPHDSLVAGNYLFMAAEAMQAAVTQKLYAQYNIGKNAKERKHRLAVAMGYPDINGNGGRDLNLLDSDIRRKYVFNDDDSTYEALKEASHGFEHGYSNIVEINAVFDKLFEPSWKTLRKAWLGLMDQVPEATVLIASPGYELPLYGWPPVAVLEGLIPQSAEADVAAGKLLQFQGEMTADARILEGGVNGTTSLPVTLKGRSHGIPVTLVAHSLLMPSRMQGEIGNANISVNGQPNE